MIGFEEAFADRSGRRNMVRATVAEDMALKPGDTVTVQLMEPVTATISG
ncbi:MAG: hypothetical protein KGZ93_05740 [Actinobacteria bacterium]|nr:hypothetical protein [Actinomycetota bacterium]